jgi:peptidoglycan/LPS O-acetylase OafA/YrhL
VAAALVLVHHLVIYAPTLTVVSQLASIGYVGVTFFFVLSGFVLTWAWSPEMRARTFYRRRFARVYPVHLLFVVVSAVVFSERRDWGALPANVSLLHAWSPDDTVVRSFSGVSWSLSCELFFYAAFPLLVRGVLRVQRCLLAGAAVFILGLSIGLLVEALSPELGLLIFHLPAFRVVEFACGSLAAAAMMRGWSPKVRVSRAAMFVVVSYVCLLLLPVAIGYRLEDRWAITLAMVPSCVLLITSCARGDIEGERSILRRRMPVRLGQWSFCVYMVHPMVLAVAAPWLQSRDVVSALVASVVVVVAVVLAAFILHVTVERPVERILRGGGEVRASTLRPATPFDPVTSAVVAAPGPRAAGAPALGFSGGLGPATG